MKKFFKYTMTMALAVLALASCSNSEYKYDGPGQWNANEGYAQVQFAKTSLSVELAPTDPAQTTIQLTRLNTVGSAVVNFEIETNTDDVFTVTPATFADGEETATAVVSFPKAEVGKEYILKLVITDPNMVSQYSASNGCTLSVMRVKWNDAGFIYTDAAKTQKQEGYAMYTEDFLTTFYSVQNVSFVTKLQERDDKPGYFRMVNTYHENYPYNDPGDWDDTKDYYIFIDATDPKKVFIPHYCTSGMIWSYGEFRFSSMAGYYLAKDDEESAAPYYGTYENGAITFPKEALLISMANYQTGGFYNSNVNGAFKLVIDPDKALYTAKVSDYVFNTEGLVFAGLFTSNKLKSEKEGVMLIKGATDPEVEAANKGCYDRFETKYGAPYLIVAPYADSYHLAFCVNADGKVVIPEEIANQPIGIKAMGEDVYAHINGGASTFGKSEIVLNITFQNEDGSVIYGETNETLAYITWTQVGTGTYTYNFWWEGEDDGYAVFQRDDKPNMYKIADWGNGSEFIFTWNKSNGKVTVPINSTGDMYGDYGTVYVSDGPTCLATFGYEATYEEYPCTYDEATSIFSFSLLYFVSQGWFNQGAAPAVETLKVDWGSTAAPAAISRRAATKKENKQHSLTRKNWKIFAGKKVNRKAMLNKTAENSFFAE